MLVTPLYAATAALIFVFLSVRTLLLRRRFKVAIGDSDEPMLLRATRAHSNFAEYVPLALLLLYFLERSGASAWLLHGLALSLLLGRIIHAFGVSQVEENYRFRVAGMGLTFMMIIISATYLLVQVLSGHL